MLIFKFKRPPELSARGHPRRAGGRPRSRPSWSLLARSAPSRAQDGGWGPGRPPAPSTGQGSGASLVLGCAPGLPRPTWRGERPAPRSDRQRRAVGDAGQTPQLYGVLGQPSSSGVEGGRSLLTCKGHYPQPTRSLKGIMGLLRCLLGRRGPGPGPGPHPGVTAGTPGPREVAGGDDDDGDGW